MSKLQKRGYVINTAVLVVLFALFMLISGSLGGTDSFKLILVPSIWQCCYLIILAASLNLVLGFLGQLSLGHCGFMAIGAYTAALMSLAFQRAGVYDEKSGAVFIAIIFLCIIAAGLLAAVIGADDHVVEFEITPNRPDCLSVIGLAREASATFHKPLKLHTPEIKGCGGSIADLVDIEIEDAELCPRYTARMVKNVKIQPSPAWMRERLRNSGVRPINNIVDITNYVMLEYGQPMHAFDFSCVEGGHIVVRTAREGEAIQTLDGKDHALTTSMLCICDEHRPVCVAGVMGGANSEIVGDTAMVVFESANFNGASVRRTATALGMRTDASSRYEKGLDPMNTMKAVQRACELVELLGAGEVVDGVIDILNYVPQPRVLKLEPEKINALLGTDVSEAEMRRILLSLGFGLEGDTILVPSWRSDVEHYSDIAEEVARFYGYNCLLYTSDAADD